MTVVTADAARPIGADSFADLPGMADISAQVAVVGGKVQVTFDADLTPEQRTAVCLRMESRDDEDQERRAVLRAADGATNLAEMVRAYVLGDPLPDPIYPEES